MRGLAEQPNADPGDPLFPDHEGKALTKIQLVASWTRTLGQEHVGSLRQAIRSDDVHPSRGGHTDSGLPGKMEVICRIPIRGGGDEGDAPSTIGPEEACGRGRASRTGTLENGPTRCRRRSTRQPSRMEEVAYHLRTTGLSGRCREPEDG